MLVPLRRWWSAVVSCCFVGALQAQGSGPVSFNMEEMLFHPRADGVTLAMQPAEPVELRVSYASLSGLGLSTASRSARAGELVTFELDGLWPSDEFAYRVEARRPSESVFRPREVHVFRTTRLPGSTFRFGVAADTHAYAVWARSQCNLGGGNAADWLVLEATLDRFQKSANLDFVVAGTDSVMTRCGPNCPACEVDGEPLSPGDAASLFDARLRYRKVFGPEIYGRFGKDRPMLFMFGDHDGEQGWVGSYCDIPPEILPWTLQARSEFVPNPVAHYGGASSGRSYAMTSGDLLLVVLDPLSQTIDPPISPEGFTLGARQLDWLEETLAASDATFKIVMSEHLLGGISSPEQVCWKGRGGIRSTQDGLPTGVFLGEQFLVHELMKKYGAQLFLSFHDHVAVLAEKPGLDGFGEGVVYAIGGRASGVGHPWISEDWYRQAMDYDLDGVPEYETGVTGTTAPGWFEITVHGSEQLELRYRASAALPQLDGTTLLHDTITPEGALVRVD